MKKITFLFFVLVSVTLFGQNKLTSSVREYFDGSNWSNSGRSEYTYDDNKNLTKETELSWDYLTSQWKESYATNYVYNSDNKVITETYENFDSDGNSTGEQYRTINTYNSSGNLIQILNQEFTNSIWINEGKFDLTYTNNKLTAALGYEWDGSAWVFGDDDSFKMAISYDANGKISLSETYEWNGTAWVDADKTVYTYDANNRLIVEDGQTWDGTNWVSEYKNEYTYDGNGNTVTGIESYLEDDVFTAQPMETFTFDTSQLMANFAHPFRDKTGLDVIFPSYLFVNKILSRSSDSYRTIYNYNESTANLNAFSLVDFAVYPNPTNAFLTIDDSNFTLKTVEVFNLLGKKILISTKNQLNVETLVNGIYLLKVQDDKGNISIKRFVKK
ncbi:T9SS type A sorting domain-containing protein [uncultured Polaribacter sp.]|uniref:T9SS type A sorting domain-containing protein n=1 Tax=uncultured Polaribacter sp. TaxID=174711 RepID=UPI0030DAB54D|tara:strand:- start:5293 stop:6453 length:1161 start_codon:yes stop_codon:yes gene_type:complete